MTNRKIIYGLFELSEGMVMDITEPQIEKYRQTARYYLKQSEKITMKFAEPEKKTNRLN